ncbi:MAG: hypothetical protein Q8L55_09955, partial [Phycisphaerales bacterium]|nr:hypothetical protein [Phycisphaerales bacterium]
TMNLTRQYGTEQAANTDWKKNLMEQTGLNEEQADARINQLADTYLASAGRSGNASLEGANALAEYRGLGRLFDSYRDVPQTSANRITAEARRQLDVALIKYIYVPLTEARIAAAPAPTAEEMQAQFEKHKDTTVGTGENGAGYRQNDRVTYTWFSIDKAATSKAVRIDPIEVQRRAIPRQTAEGTLDPAVRRQIEDEIRGEMTQRVIDDFTREVRAEFLRDSALLPDKHGYKVLPADWTKPDVTAAVGAALQRLPVADRAALAVSPINTVATPQDARAFVMQTGVGTSMLSRTGQQPLYLRDVLFGAKELDKPAGRVPAQVGLPITSPFTGGNGMLYFVMLDSVLPAASPTSLDEVRAMVEKDIRKAKALQTLKAEIEGVLPAVVLFGMTDAPAQLEKIGYPGLTVQSGFAQRARGVATEQGAPAQDELQDMEFVDAALTHAEKLDPSLRVTADSALDRTFVHALAGGSGAVLTQITGLRPLTQEAFRYLFVFDQDLRARLTFQDMPKIEVAPFNTDQLVKRLNVTGLDRTKKSNESP